MSEPMILSIIFIAFMLLMSSVAIFANLHLPTADRLPMQWGLNGRETWTAPRKIALGFFPLFGGISMLGYIFLIRHTGPRAGQENLVVPIFVLFGLLFLAIQLFYGWMANRSLRQQ